MNLAIPSIVLLIVVMGLTCRGQQARTINHAVTQNGSSGTMPKTISSTTCRDVHVLEDPFTHLRWIRLLDSVHPTGPARLIPLPSTTGIEIQDAGCTMSGATFAATREQRLPVIRAGEHIIIEQQTSFARLRLEATALAPALPGAFVRVQLKTDGQVLSVIADGPRHARLPAGTGAARW